MKPPPSSVQRMPAPAFSLVEMLVAFGVLSLMMVFLFNLVGQTFRAWESGSRQVEAAQSARIGLETMAQDLQFALGGSAVSVVGNTTKTNIVPFFSRNNSTERLGLPGAFNLAPSSGQIFVVAPLPSAGNDLYELGYLSVFVTAAGSGEGFSDMRGRRYVLMRHAISGTSAAAAGRGNFYYVNSVPSGAADWLVEASTAVSEFNRSSLIPNCYQLVFRYASNNNGVLAFSDTWTAADRLPAGVLVTAKVMDEKTAARIAALRPNGLSSADLNSGGENVVGRVLREGTIEVSRFIPFVNARP